MKKKILILCAVLLLAAGCGDKKAESVSPAASGSQPESSEPSESVSEPEEESSESTEADTSDAYTLYSQMEEKMAGITSMEMQGTIDIDMEMESTVEGVESQSVSMVMNFNMAQLILSETDIEMAMSMSAAQEQAESMTVSLYYKDGYLYQDTGTAKTKLKMDFEDALASANMMNNLQIMEEFVQTSFVETVDNGTKITMLLKGEYATEILGDSLDTMLESMGMTDAGVSFEDFNYSFIVDADGMMKTCRMAYGMTMDLMGMKVSVNYVFDFDLTSINSVEAIEYPADLDTYEEPTAESQSAVA